MLLIDRDSVFRDKGSLNLQHVHAEILVVQAQAFYGKRLGYLNFQNSLVKG